MGLLLQETLASFCVLSTYRVISVFFTTCALLVSGKELRNALICFTLIFPAFTEKMRSDFSSSPFTCSTTTYMATNGDRREVRVGEGGS